MKPLPPLSALAAVACLLSPLAARAELQWIWSSPKASANERAVFRKQFDVAGEIASASLQATCDNGAKIFLNNQLAVENADWMEPVRTSVGGLLKPGKNDLRVEARNKDGSAALVVRLRIKTADGKETVIDTDGTWEAAAPGSDQWKTAHVVAKYGAQPWGNALEEGGKKGGAGVATDPKDIQAPPGFKVELVYTVPKSEQGSWVSMTHDPKGRIIACDQKGALYRLTVPEAPGGEARVEQLATKKVGGAHGLLYAFDSLYVMVNEKADKGLWRLKDKDGDGQFETEEFLRKIVGSGEHGPHGLRLSPDGKSIYFASGNHTGLPENMELSRAPRAWGEDHVIPRLWDANGHARNVFAPGGYIGKTDPDGKVFELFSYGYRNQYGIAFNDLGDLFTYDSDMEWDAGTPWYKPTLICLATSGSDLGWRSGAGNWPKYYPDSLPPLLEIGPGSPTGVLAGTGAKFPAKYQRAIFASDWTYGTMYAIHLTPEGASYKAEKEEFITGRPLPLTDLIIRPQDGAMYFAIGGRGTQSAVYRVTYTGPESTAPAAAPEMTPEHRLRRELEALHLEGTGPEAIEKAWPHLGHKDRFIRWAARIAVERQPANLWAERALASTDPQALLEGAVAVARLADKSLQPRLLDRLHALDFAKLSDDQKLALVRAYQLALTRMGMPEGEAKAKLLARAEALYPATSNFLNRELCQLLVALDSTQVVPKTVQLMMTARDEADEAAQETLLSRNQGYAAAFARASSSRPNRQQIAYAYALRCAKTGWTPELRKTFFAWFPRTGPWQGGNSFKKFLENIRTEALANVADETERTALAALSSQKEAPAIAANVVMPKGPGRNYTIDDVLLLAKDGLKGRDFENGKAMFAATMCLTCHRFNGEGGGLGPDITGAGARYSLRDLLENIIEPSKVISDQYESHQVEKKDGSTVIGRIVVEENGKVFVATNPFAPQDTLAIDENQAAARKVYPVSMMPPGLINSLNADELLNLLAYIQSAGNPQDKAFAKK